jgi:hypothetical protein
MHTQFVAPQAEWAHVILRQPINRTKIKILAEIIEDIAALAAPPAFPDLADRKGGGKHSGR